MDIYELAEYVNLDVDDEYSPLDIARWFNKGIANYNLIPPLTSYPSIALNEDAYDQTLEPDNSTFLLGVMVPFINHSIMTQDIALEERQLHLQDFIRNATEYKKIYPIPSERLVDDINTNLDDYRLGQNVFVSDMNYSPMQGEWSKRANYYQVNNKEETNPTSWTDIEGEDIDG